MNREGYTFFNAIKSHWGWFAISSTLAAAILSIGIIGGGGWLVVVTGMGVVMFVMHQLPNDQNIRRRAVTCGIAAGLVLVTLGINALTIHKSIKKPHEWDFLDFWIAGQSIVSDRNIYDPDEYQQVQLPFEPSDEFKREVLDVGFKYPPTSAVIFMPLGYFSFKTAKMLWYIFQFLFFVSSILLAFRLFASQFDAIHLLLTAALFMSLSATASTFYFGQTNFMALTFLLLFRKSYKTIIGGLFLSLGIIIKPFLIIFLPYCLIRGHLRAFVAATLGLSFFSLIGLLLLGEQTFVTYFVANPSAHFPHWMYTEKMNQSLLATILRLIDYQSANGTPVLNPAFLLSAILMVTVTGWYCTNHSWPLPGLGRACSCHSWRSGLDMACT